MKSNYFTESPSKGDNIWKQEVLSPPDALAWGFFCVG